MIAPIIFGAQRFGASEGLSVEKSAMQDGVAGGLGWASGELSFVSSAASRRRRLQGKEASEREVEEEEEEGDDDGFLATWPVELIKLCNQLITTGITVFGIVLMQLIAVWYWRHRANRTFYAAERRTREASFGAGEWVAASVQETVPRVETKATFHRLPKVSGLAEPPPVCTSHVHEGSHPGASHSHH